MLAVGMYGTSCGVHHDESDARERVRDRNA